MEAGQNAIVNGEERRAQTGEREREPCNLEPKGQHALVHMHRGRGGRLGLAVNDCRWGYKDKRSEGPMAPPW